jgi:hypothetical protein
MRTYRFVAILIVLTATASAGPVNPAWIQHYTGVTQSQLNQAADSYLDTLTGSLYVVGSGELAGHSGESDLMVVKYRQNGTRAWVRGFSGSGSSPDDMAQAVAVDSAGNVYIAGVAGNPAPDLYDAAWAKYDSNGVELWRRTSGLSGNDEAFGIAIGNGGDVYICGSGSGYGSLTGYMVARIDPTDGDTLWKRSYVLDTNALSRHNPGRDIHPDYFDDYLYYDNVAVSIAASPDSGIVATGHGLDYNWDFEWWTMKFTPSGVQSWAAVYHNPSTVYHDDDVAFDVAVADNGDVYAVGFDYLETSSNYQGYNYAVVRYSPTGSRLGWRSLNMGVADGDDYAFSVALDDSAPQNVYVTGVLEYPSPELDQVSTMKFNSTLTSLWGSAGATYGGIGNDRGYSVCYRKGRVYVTGQSADDLVVLGYTAANATGKDTIWTYRYDGPDHLVDLGAAVCASDSDDVFVSGEVTRAGDPDWSSLFTARLRYGNPDMAVTSIVSPQGTYDHYDTVVPRATVRNYGNVIPAFNAFMYIGLSYGDTVTVYDGPAPGQSAVVSFAPWAAHPTGLVPLRCSLETPGDVDPNNDFFSDTVQVFPIDVGCQLILSPASPVDSGSYVMPVARFKNQGATTQSFPVWFRIETTGRAAAKRLGGLTTDGVAAGAGSLPAIGRIEHPTDGPPLQVYEDSTSVTLAAQDSSDVSFEIWQATAPGTYHMEAFAALLGDDNQTNDTVDAQLIVRQPVRDVGVSAILAPADTVDSGTVVVPRVVITNYSGLEESFRIRFTIGAFFSSETAMTLPGSTSDTAEFEPWTAAQVGAHTARCSTMLAVDSNPGNDFLQKQVVVGPAGGVESPEDFLGLPREYALGSPRPNPFTGRMLVPYALPTRSQISLRIYDASGALVRTLTSAELPAGFHHVTWNGTDERGRRLLPGTYFCRLQAPGFARIAKLVMSD